MVNSVARIVLVSQKKGCRMRPGARINELPFAALVTIGMVLVTIPVRFHGTLRQLGIRCWLDVVRQGKTRNCIGN